MLDGAQPFDSGEFRKALSLFPTGVAIITTAADGGAPVGLTCNSFSSVSLAPPLVSWGLRKESRSAEAFRASGAFAINILSADQQALSARFASGAIPNKFEGVGWTAGHRGVPLLNDCAAAFECETFAIHDAGDHLLFIGEVRHFSHQISQHPLVFCKGAYMLLSQALTEVSRQSPTRSAEMVEARRLIHGGLIELACRNGLARDFDEMEIRLDAMERHASTGALGQRFAAGVEFFQLIGQATHNSVVAVLAGSLADAMRRDMVNLPPERRADLDPARREILHYLRLRDAAGAGGALENYLNLLASAEVPQVEMAL